MQFSDLVGETVPMLIPMINPTALQLVILRGVDSGGIWIESENMTQAMLQGLNLPGSKTPIFFVPYHGIKFAFFGGKKLALNEKAFGV